MLQKCIIISDKIKIHKNILQFYDDWRQKYLCSIFARNCTCTAQWPMTWVVRKSPLSGYWDQPIRRRPRGADQWEASDCLASPWDTIIYTEHWNATQCNVYTARTRVIHYCSVRTKHFSEKVSKGFTEFVLRSSLYRCRMWNLHHGI